MRAFALGVCAPEKLRFRFVCKSRRFWRIVGNEPNTRCTSKRTKRVVWAFFVLAHRLLALATLLLASTASASIALFSDGRNMKIEAYSVEEDTIHLTMQGGGKMSLPLARIERILDDEIITPEVVEEVKKIVEKGGVFPHRSWRFSELSQPLFQSKYNEIIIDAARQFDVDAALEIGRAHV